MRVRNLMQFLTKRPRERQVVTRGWFGLGLVPPAIESDEIIPGTVMLWSGPVTVSDAKVCARYHPDPKFARRFEEMLTLPRERVVVIDGAHEGASISVRDVVEQLAGFDADIRILVPGYGERGLRNAQAAHINVYGESLVFIDYDHEPSRRIPRSPRKVEERMVENFVRLLKGTR